MSISSHTRMSPPPPSQGHHSCWPGTARTGLHQLPSIQNPRPTEHRVLSLQLLGQNSTPRVLVASPSDPSPFHTQSSTAHQEVCPKQEVTEVTSVCHHRPGCPLLVPHFSAVCSCRMEPLPARGSTGSAAPRLCRAAGREISPPAVVGTATARVAPSWAPGTSVGLSPERGTGGQSPGPRVTWSGDSASPVDGAGAPGVTAMPTVVRCPCCHQC